jgi:hypothetical protein
MQVSQELMDANGAGVQEVVTTYALGDADAGTVAAGVKVLRDQGNTVEAVTQIGGGPDGRGVHTTVTATHVSK